MARPKQCPVEQQASVQILQQQMELFQTFEQQTLENIDTVQSKIREILSKNTLEKKTPFCSAEKILMYCTANNAFLCLQQQLQSLQAFQQQTLEIINTVQSIICELQEEMTAVSFQRRRFCAMLKLFQKEYLDFRERNRKLKLELSRLTKENRSLKQELERTWGEMQQIKEKETAAKSELQANLQVMQTLDAKDLHLEMTQQEHSDHVSKDRGSVTQPVLTIKNEHKCGHLLSGTDLETARLTAAHEKAILNESKHHIPLPKFGKECHQVNNTNDPTKLEQQFPKSLQNDTGLLAGNTQKSGFLPTEELNSSEESAEMVTSLEESPLAAMIEVFQKEYLEFRETNRKLKLELYQLTKEMSSPNQELESTQGEIQQIKEKETAAKSELQTNLQVMQTLDVKNPNLKMTQQEHSDTTQKPQKDFENLQLSKDFAEKKLMPEVRNAKADIHLLKSNSATVNRECKRLSRAITNVTVQNQFLKKEPHQVSRGRGSVTQPILTAKNEHECGHLLSGTDLETARLTAAHEKAILSESEHQRPLPKFGKECHQVNIKSNSATVNRVQEAVESNNKCQSGKSLA